MVLQGQEWVQMFQVLTLKIMDQFMAWMVEKRTRRKHPTTAKLQENGVSCWWKCPLWLEAETETTHALGRALGLDLVPVRSKKVPKKDNDFHSDNNINAGNSFGNIG